jgi:hypothetical protein
VAALVGVAVDAAAQIDAGAGAAAPEAPAADAPPQMPDPRQMSGIPRGDPQDPPGQLTVRVIQGSIVMNAPAGTLVHLVGVAADGRVLHSTKPITSEGRALFTGLATDGSIAYYAAALLPRAGDHDRLMSQVITMPPQVGLRVMLAGLDPESTEPPVDDLAPPGAARLPAGEVMVSVAGDVADVTEVRLVDLADPAAVRKSPVSGAGNKVARSSGVPGGPDKMYIAEATSGGRVYRSPPFQLTGQRGVHAGLFVWKTLLFGFHAGAQMDDDKLWFEAQIALLNETGTPYKPDGDGLVIPLPRGFVGASVGEQAGPAVKVDPDRGFVVTSAVPPGQRQFVGQFALKTEDGRAELDMPMPFGAFQSQMFIEHVPGMRLDVESPANTKQEPRSTGGRSFLMLSNINVRPGQSLRFTLTGLPQPPKWWNRSRIAAGAVVLGLLAIGVVGTFRRGAAARAVEAAGAGGRAEQLVLERDRLYDSLAHLERQRLAGAVAEGRYAKARATLTEKLRRIHEELRAS